jgi:hypothetical protein
LAGVPDGSRRTRRLHGFGVLLHHRHLASAAGADGSKPWPSQSLASFTRPGGSGRALTSIRRLL